MQYPVQLTQIGAEKAIYIPAYEAVKAIYAALLELDPATPFPYWAKVFGPRQLHCIMCFKSIQA